MIKFIIAFFDYFIDNKLYKSKLAGDIIFVGWFINVLCVIVGIKPFVIITFQHTSRSDSFMIFLFLAFPILSLISHGLMENAIFKKVRLIGSGIIYLIFAITLAWGIPILW